MQRQTKERQVVQAQVQACSSKTSCSHGLGDTLSNKGPMGIRIDGRSSIDPLGTTCQGHLGPHLQCCPTLSNSMPKAWEGNPQFWIQVHTKPKEGTPSNCAWQRRAPSNCAWQCLAPCQGKTRSELKIECAKCRAPLTHISETFYLYFIFVVYFLIPLSLHIMAPRQGHRAERVIYVTYLFYIIFCYSLLLCMANGFGHQT